MTKPEWQQLELLVTEIQKQLAPNAVVLHNVKLPGHLSETQRQIDVLVEQQVGQYAIRIAIDCKDYSTPVDVKGIEEFHGLVQDVGVHKGALVCPAGFTKAAKKRAKKLHIDLYSPADTEPHKWQVHLMLPVLCDFRATRIGFSVVHSEPLPLRLPERFYDLTVFDEEGHDLGTLYAVACAAWERGELPIDPGDHAKVAVFGGKVTKIDNGYGQLTRVTLTTNLDVRRRLYFGYVPVEKLRGLRDEHTGQVITNAFTLGALDPVQVQNQWEKVPDESSLPCPPTISVIGLVSLGPDQ